jgi:hypothetical protein
MTIGLVDRHPSLSEIEKLRLILSTFQDGSGQQAIKGGRTLPGWRDFDRAVALVFGGEAQESKAIFDVLISDPTRPGISVGVACKMRRTLDTTTKTGRVTLELSNSTGKFWQALAERGINQNNYRTNPSSVGAAVVHLIERWQQMVHSTVDLARSTYLDLSWNRAGWYQRHRFARPLPDPTTLSWDFPPKKEKAADDETEEEGRRLRGRIGDTTIFEWYGESGGQLKYYPHQDTALWYSQLFQLEALPEDKAGTGIIAKVQDYYPQQWAAAGNSAP